jgi:hypothetical protein
MEVAVTVSASRDLIATTSPWLAVQAPIAASIVE